MGNTIFKNKIDEQTENISNINEYMLYYIRDLIKTYSLLNYTEIVKTLNEKKDAYPYTSLDDILIDMDWFAELYSDIEYFIAARDIYGHALTLRQWILPSNHQAITKNLEKLMNCHACLRDSNAARIIFENIMARQKYSKYLCLNPKI